VSNVPLAQKSFWTRSMVLLGDDSQVDARLGLFGDSANLDTRLGTVCAECTIGSEIIFDAPDGSPR
jgi:hypothetical protein